MKRTPLLVPLVVAALLVAGPAHAAPVEFPLGKPMGHLGLWEQELNGATASINRFFGKNGASLELDAGDRSAPGSGGQVFVSTDAGFVPGVTRLSRITELSYWTLGTAASSAARLQIEVDLDGGLPTPDTTLVFEPARQHAVEAWRWYHFDTLAGSWYSTRNIPGFVAVTTLRTWDEIVSRWPDAVVSLVPPGPGGSLRLHFGSAAGDSAGRHAHVDDLSIKSARVPRVTFTFDGSVPALGRGVPAP